MAKAKKTTAASQIRSYLSRRKTPANMTQVIEGVYSKGSSYSEETIRRTVYHMVESGIVENRATSRRPNGSQFVLRRAS